MMYHSTNAAPPPLPAKPDTIASRQSFRNSPSTVGNGSPRLLRSPIQLPCSHSPTPDSIQHGIHSRALPTPDTVLKTLPPSLSSEPLFKSENDFEGHSQDSQGGPSHLEPLTDDFDLLPRTIQSEPRSAIYDDLVKRENLSAIVTDSSVLPMKVAFCDSIYGLCESFTFVENELFDIHFMKESTFANILTSMNEQVKIPLQAPFQYTLDYSPSAICDAEYKVPQLMKLYNLPTVAVVRDYQGSQSKRQKNKTSEFIPGEVLIFKDRIKSNTIECFSLSHKETKRIHKSSELTLTTNPSQLAFKFTDLIFFDLPLQILCYPSQAKLQPQFRSTSTILSLHKEKSLITSFSDAKLQEGGNIKIYEIFVDAEIDFQRVHTLPNERIELIKKSKEIFDNFSPTKVKQVVPNAKNHISQKDMYELLIVPSDYGDEELWRNVTELFRPKAFNQIPDSCTAADQHRNKKEEQVSTEEPTKQLSVDPNSIKTTTTTPAAAADSPDYDYVSSQVPRAAVRPNSIVIEPYVPMISPKLIHSSRMQSSHVTSPTTAPPPTSTTTIPRTSVPPPATADGYSRMQPSLPTMARSPSMTTTSHPPPAVPPRDHQQQPNQPQTPPEEQDGKGLQLEDLSCDQVILMLDKLGLSKYKNLFIEEKISGSILREIDEEMLEEDLGITSKLHRLKLRRVIEGREPLNEMFK